MAIILIGVLLSACASEMDMHSPAGLAVPSCPGDLCTEGVNVNDRFYALLCWGVDPSAVTDDVVVSGTGVLAEVRPIRGLPQDLWLAVTGELPCRPAPGAPLQYEWYLLENPELTIEERRRHLAVFRAVTTEP